MPFIIFKTFVFIGFLFIIFYTAATQDMTFIITTGVSLILVPIISMIYTYTLFNMPCMALRRQNNQANQNVNQNN